MKKLLPTVTVAISALNEEENIQNFLKSVLMQKEDGFVLKQIWVHSDGSTDDTVKLARALNSKIIKVWAHKKREGKSTWLNKIYKDLDTDILVQSDADVIFAHKYVIRDLIKPLLKNNNIKMTAGNEAPYEVNSFFEKAMHSTFQAYTNLRLSINEGSNVYSAIGEILAYKKEFAKQLNIPSNTIANDIYTYFTCKSKGYDFKFVKSALIYFRYPQNVKDHIRQNTRFEAGPIRMEKLFDADLVKREYYVSSFKFWTIMLKQFVKEPANSLYIFVINLYCKFRAKKAELRLTATWPMAVTTKKLIKRHYEK